MGRSFAIKFKRMKKFLLGLLLICAFSISTYAIKITASCGVVWEFPDDACPDMDCLMDFVMYADDYFCE
jgi:hypothetical protein